VASYFKFWESWENKTEREVLAIEVVKKFREIILKEFLIDKIYSIYIKGSFTRREMNKDSDIDFVVIVKDNGYILEAERLDEKYKDKFDIEVGVSVQSLWELKNNEHFHKPEGPKARPFLFLKKVGDYKLIYGEEINPAKMSSKEARAHLDKRIGTFRDLFIPLYLEREKLDFNQLIKQVFWLVECEQEALEKKDIGSWKKLRDCIENENHIIYLTYEYRQNEPKNKKIREEYIEKLNDYLDKLS